MDKLYKFVRTQSAVQHMLLGNLGFSTTEELNDPCELLDEINEEAVAESLKEMRRAGYSESEFNWLRRQAALLQALAPHDQAISLPRSPADAHAQVMSAFYNDIDRMAQLQRAAVRNIRKSCGIMSLTSRYDSLPLWAHYADNAKGFAIVFRDLKDTFPGDETGVLDDVKPVHYSSEFIGMTFVPSTQQNLFFWKLADWAYEREVRVVSSLEKCTRVVVGDRQIHSRRIDPLHAASVIIGWKADPKVRSEILEFIKSLGRPVSVFAARVFKATVVLDPIHNA